MINSELKENYAKAKQDPVFAFYDSLNVAEKAALYAQISSFEPE